MSVLKHQLSHARPRARATDRVNDLPEPDKVRSDADERRELP
jgi:hypothetical protein